MNSETLSHSSNAELPLKWNSSRDGQLSEEVEIEDSPSDLPSKRLFNLAAFLLAAVALYDGMDAWKSWFFSPDRRFFVLCAVVGIGIALLRSKWSGNEHRWKSWLASTLYASATLLILAGFTRTNPWWSGIPCSMIFAGWCIVRIRGESVVYNLFLGSVVAAPYIIEWMEAAGWFQWLESTVITMTALLADMASRPYARMEDGLLFRSGLVDRFACMGTWDSVITFLGVALFCILAFRRFLVSSSLLLFLSFVVWAVLRSSTIIAFLSVANDGGGARTFSSFMVFAMTCIGGYLVVSLDRMLAAILQPIPFKYFNTKSPFPALAWNWICGLPKLTVRIPKDNKITLRWKHKLFEEGKKSSILTDCNWLLIVLREMPRHPLNAVGGVIDAVRGWRISRSWKSILANVPSFVFISVVCISAAVYSTRRNDGQIRFMTNESQNFCPTDLLESVSNQLFESDFQKAISYVGESISDSNTTVSEDELREVEFFCKRILSVDPKNQMAKYRLGMVRANQGQTDEAFAEMSQLTDMPQAHAWLVKAILSTKVSGKEVEMKDLLAHLEMAKKWDKCDFRMPFYYARLLEKRGDLSKSAFILKQAVAAKPEYILELARFYERTKNIEGRIKAANEAEAYFFSKLNSDEEKESDRLSLADAKILANRPEEAADILEEGLKRNPNLEKTRDQLCKIQLFLYANSGHEDENGNMVLDQSLLEKAALTAPNNLEVTSEIGKLVNLSIKPTEVLSEILKKQLELKTASAKSLLFMGDECYIQGDLKGAMKYWESALEKEPTDCTVLNNIASCLVKISPPNVDRAIELITKANSILPDNPDILDTWGEIMLAANRPKEAIPKFEKAIRLDKSRMETRKKIIVAYEACGMKEMADAQSKVILTLGQKKDE